MAIGLAFWIIMLLWLIVGVPWPWWPSAWPGWPGHVLLFILFLLLGWHAFGPPLRG
jgi:hypothetical protein